MRKTKSGTATIIMGVALVIIGIFMIVFALVSPESRLVAGDENVPYASNNVYDMGQVLVIDKYGYIESARNGYEDYYLIAYYTEDDDIAHLASLKVTEDKNIFNKLDSYAQDDKAYIGDLYINLCAKAAPLDSIDPEMLGYYNDAVDTYSEYLSGVENSQTALTFYCEGAEAFPSALESEGHGKTAVKVIGAVIILLGIILLPIGIDKKKKENALEAQMAQQGVYYAPVNQPNVYYNPQPGANQWNSGAPYQQPQNGANQWNNQAPQVNSQPSNTNTNQYYTPPTESNASRTTAPDNSAQNNQQ